MADSPDSTPTTPDPIGFGSGPGGPWALEETLKKVLVTLQKDLTLDTKYNKNFNTLSKNFDKLAAVLTANNATGSGTADKELAAAQQGNKVLTDLQKNIKRQRAIQEENLRHQKTSKNGARDALLGGGGSGSGKMSSMANDLTKQAKKSVKSAASAIANSGGDINQATSGVANAIPIIGGLLAGAAKMVTSAQSQMEQLAKIGQTFGSSLTGMAQAAADGAVSMPQATALLTQNSEAAAKMGGANFLKLQKQVRGTTEKFGRFGYSIEDQGKIVANFYEMQMMAGHRSTAINAKAVANYTAQLSTLSEITGKTAEQLMDEQKKTQQNPDVYAAATRVFQRSGQQAAKNFEDVTKISGNLMPTSMKALNEKMLSDYGKYGSIATSELGSVITGAGRGDLTKKMDDAIKSGDSTAYMAAMKELASAAQDFKSPLRAALSNYELSTGAMGDASKQVIPGLMDLNAQSDKVAKSLADQTQANKEKAQKADLAKLTQAQTEMQARLAQSEVQLLKAAEPLYLGLIHIATAAATAINSLVGFAPIQHLAATLGEALASTGDMLKALFTGIEPPFSAFIKAVVWIVEEFGKLGGAIGGIVGLSGPGKAAGIIGGAMLAKGAVGIGVRGGARLLGRAAARVGGSVASRVGINVAEKTGVGVAEKVAEKGALGVGGKMLGKAAGKFIPGIGLVFGAAEAYNRFESGDKLGAVIAGISGVASLVPGLGTAVSVGATALNAYRDASGQSGTDMFGNKVKPDPKAQEVHDQTAQNQQQQHTTAMKHMAVEQKVDKKEMTVDAKNTLWLFKYKVALENELLKFQMKMITFRHNYEIQLINQHYGVSTTGPAGAKGRGAKHNVITPDAAFKGQLEQAARIKKSTEDYQAKAAKMGALSQAGVIVQPAIGDDIGSKQLQEMKLTNQFLYNIYDNSKGQNKFKPLVTVYQPGL